MECITPFIHKSLSRRQRGSTLFMLLLLIMTIVIMTLSVLYLARNQYQLTGNIQHSQLAFSNAEEAMRTAETWLTSGTNFKADGFTTYNQANTPQLYPQGQLAQLGRDPLTMNWDGTNSAAAAGNANNRYFIERMGPKVVMTGFSIQLGRVQQDCQAASLFRVVSRAVGVRDAMRIMESNYAVKDCD